MDVTGMYLAILFPLSYNLVHNYLHRYHHPNHLILIQYNNSKEKKVDVGVVVLVMCSLFLAVGFLLFLTTYIPHLDPALVVVPLVVGILVTTLKIQEKSKKFQGKFHTSLFVGAVVCLAIGFICWILDKERIVCFPHSVFQLHAVWHVTTAVSLLCIYLYQRSENHNAVGHVFKLK